MLHSTSTTWIRPPKAIAENADIAIGAKVRMLENVIAKNAIEPLRQ